MVSGWISTSTNTPLACGSAVLAISTALDFVLGPQRTNRDVADLIYNNLYRQAPSTDELEALVSDFLDSGAYTRGRLGRLASQHVLNAANINLIKLVDVGLQYLA